MSNAILLSSSPALASRRSLATGRSSSPEFPSLEELVSQRANLANARAPSQSISTAGGFTRGGSALRDDLGKETSPVGEGGFEVEGAPIDAPDLSLVEISPIDLDTPSPRAGPKPKKAPVNRKPARARGVGAKASAKETSTNSTSREHSPNELATAPEATKPRRKQTGSVSRHFKPPQEPARSKTPENIDRPLNLDTAITRRVDWTPPPKDTIVEFGSRSSDIIELPPSSKPQNVGRDRELFQSLTETYGYELSDDSLLAAESRDVQAVFKKRKLIEMVPTSNTTTTANTMGPPPLPEASPTKAKAPKKKARTITGLATAAYAPQEPELPPTKPADAPAAAPVGTNGKPAKSKVTKRKPRAPKKKDDPRMVLLPPEAALEQVAQQDFVFGTSSQLVREQDRDVCELPRLANNTMAVIEEEEYVTPINSDAIEPAEALPRLWNAAARDADGDLLHPEVIDLVQDSPSGSGILSDDSDPFGYVNMTRMTQRLASRMPNVQTGASSSVTKGSTESNAAMEPPLTIPSQTSSERQAGSSALATAHNPLLSSMTSTSPPPSSQKRLTSIYDVNSTLSNSAPLPSSQSESPTKAPSYTAPEKPKFDLYTDAQLARQVAAYGFKPVKRRAGMISLLDECWSSKYERQSGVRAYSTASVVAAATEVSAAAASTAEMPPPAQPAAEPAKKPRGRPRKNSASTPAIETAPGPPPPASAAPVEPIPAKKPRGRPRKQASPAPVSPPRRARTARSATKPAAKPAAKPIPSTPPRKRAPVLEIPDSDSEADPSSPEPIFSSPASHDVSTGDDSALSLAAPTTEESSLYAQITKAVTSAPPSTDPANPSFHEKILMYESIIVEDLAAWLNTGALDGVGYDGEVSAQDVKKWCEAKSVCCVWRYRMGGAERRML